MGILVPAALVLQAPLTSSTACTRALSTSYQHRWAARSVLQQEKIQKIQDNCKALVVLPPTHFSQTLTFSKSFLCEFK